MLGKVNIIAMSTVPESFYDLPSSASMIIIGAALCNRSTVFSQKNGWLRYVDHIKSTTNTLVALQQPVYDFDDNFLDTLNLFESYGLVDAVFINSVGIGMILRNAGLYLVWDRYGFSKGRRSNSAALELLKEMRIEAIEVYNSDSLLVQDIDNTFKIWLRESQYKQYTFSPECLYIKTTNDCSSDPAKCAGNAFDISTRYIEDFSDIHSPGYFVAFKFAGHSLFIANPPGLSCFNYEKLIVESEPYSL